MTSMYHHPSVRHDPQVYGGPMRLADLVEGYWALTASMHEEICSIYDAHMRGEKIDVRGIEARLGRPLANEPLSYTVQDGVALIPMQGVISPKANMLMQISGGQSAQLLRAEILTALNDPKVKAGVLVGDSPGGNVLGIPEAGAAWRLFAQTKPAVTFSDGTLCSAAYWIGSAAGRVYISGPTVNVGSIGVRTEVVDTSMQDAAAGIKRHKIVAGKYKTAGDGPMTPEHAAYKQAQVDYLYTLFTDTVAENLGVPAEKVLADMAEGRVFIGAQAIDAGLAHGMQSLENLVAMLADNPSAVAQCAPAPSPKSSGRKGAKATIFLPPMQAVADTAGELSGQVSAVADVTDEPVMPVAIATPVATSEEGETDMTIETRDDLEKAYPALVASIRSDAHAAGVAEGQSAETARIKAVLAQSEPGHEALVESLAFDGKSTPGDAAMAVGAARREQFKNSAKGHFSDAPQAAAPSTVPEDDPKGDNKPSRVPSAAKAYGGLNKTTA